MIIDALKLLLCTWWCLVANQDLSSLFKFTSLTLILQDMDRKMIHLLLLSSLKCLYYHDKLRC